MKTNKCLGLLAALVFPLFTTQAQTPAGAPPLGAGSPPAVSPGAAEVIKMAEAGTSDDVLLAYVKNSTSTFDLSADQILYLRDIGLSSPVITGMLSRDSELRSQAPPYTYDQKLYPATVPPPAAVASEQAPPPEPAPAPQPAAVEAPLTPPPAYVSSPPPEVGYFYDNLSPYGTWVQLDGVGWCWQPRVVVVNRGWRPYCDSGHWVYTDAGWFWQSDYSWGWAAFHYGRWSLNAGCGWVWLPDRIWGPAWVTWRSEGDHCGWAPLPPHAEFDARFGYRFNGVHVGLDFDFGLRPEHFTFIALHDFHEHDFAQRRLPPAQVTQIYNHTTIINNYVVNNNTVVNQGIKVDRVAAATHTQFKKVAIRDVPAGSPAVANARVVGKTEVAVYRPQLKAPERPVNMVAQKVDSSHPVIQHAAVIPTKPQRPLVAGSTAPTVNRGVQGQNPGNWTRPSTERAPTYSQPQNTQKPYRQNSSATPSAPAAAPAAHTEQTRPVATPSTPPSRVQPERSVTERAPINTSQPNTSHQSTPLHSETPAPSSQVSRPVPQAQNSHTYYPKGYYQAAETHILPPANARSSESHPQPSMSSHPSAPPDSNAHGQGGPPRKNDQ
jgi:hypothetical protein